MTAMANKAYKTLFPLVFLNDDLLNKKKTKATIMIKMAKTKMAIANPYKAFLNDSASSTTY